MLADSLALRDQRVPGVLSIHAGPEARRELEGRVESSGLPGKINQNEQNLCQVKWRQASISAQN